ncbi:phospho-N-acetylmuramoyl-pentapeptide-transferase [Candidatus Saccharibacteria bacterium]|nr:phospho-N-acetylmuramoyl-pentapeptide-transferase [Candidatus Saccharibacteria bacterium]
MHEQLVDEMMPMFILCAVTFVLSMLLTPIYTHFAYKYKFWKKQRTTSTTGEKLSVMNKLHAKKFTRHFPTMAGIIGVTAIIIITLLFNYSKAQTLLPLAALIGGGLVGLLDDLINVRGKGKGIAGLRSGVKFTLIIGLGLALGLYFHYKLGYDLVHIPFAGDWVVGAAIVLLFAFSVVATGNAVNISDGLDGLAGGLLTISYGAFAIIAVLQGNYGIAGFCFTAVGALLAYVWFNIYPARFMMGDVGSFAFGTALGVVAMLTNSLFLLPIIGILFVIEAGSSLLQITSKELFGRKIFISAPIHHHLEAKGWPETKITMRFWVIAAIAAAVGIIMALGGGVV